MGNPLRGLDEVRLDQLIHQATQRLRHATLEELAGIVNGIPSRPPTADVLAHSVLSLPDRGSKLLAVERAVVLHAWDSAGGNVSAAARLLGIDRKQMERKLAKARRAKGR
jgi:DNA-binding NtrC family response regulator